MSEEETWCRNALTHFNLTEKERSDLLSVMRESLSSAREAALQEAAEDHEKRAKAAEEFGHRATAEVWRCAASSVRALKSEPARRLVDVERVREALLRRVRTTVVTPREAAEQNLLFAIADDLVVDLDETGGVFFVPTQDNGVTSLIHHEPEYATVENGLLPAPRRPVADCGHVNSGDGLCAHPDNTTPECHEAACPMLPAPRKGERDE
jgi:hypothetical protein